MPSVLCMPAGLPDIVAVFIGKALRRRFAQDSAFAPC